MELSTFGAVLRFAIELEDAAAAFYEEAGGVYPEGSEVFSALAEENRRRSQTLTRIRQENVTEMILEPVAGLDGSDYLTEVGEVAAMKPADLTETALMLEERARSFYADSATKARYVLAEVGRVFERLAEAGVERQARLRHLR